MNDENKNTITYDENWQSASNYEYPVVEGAGNVDNDSDYSENEIKPKSQKASPKQLLLTIQLIICILIALAALIIKSIGGEFYTSARNAYYSELNDSAIFDNIKNLKINDLFGSASKDEV